MASNNSSEYKVVADKIVSPDEDIIFRVQGALYLNSIEEPNRLTTVSDLGNISGGSELNYVQVIGTQQIISSAPNSIIDLDITTTGKPVQISVTGEGANTTPASWVRMNLFRDGVAIGNEMQIEASAVSENVPYAINFIDDVSAGTYNYSAVITEMSGGAWQFGEASGPVMNAVELTGFKGDDGVQGVQGPAGEDGEGFNFRGAWVTDTFYSKNDVVTQNGSSYIANYDYQDTDGPYLDGDLWAPLALKGEPGTGGEGAGTGNFVFNEDNMSTNGDMTISVNGVPGTINLSAYAGINLQFAEQQSGAGLIFPDGTVQTTAFVEQITSPLPEFLTYVQGRQALPHVNINFGWDSNGVWFGPTAVDSQSDQSYPVFTSFNLNSTDKVFVSFNVDIEENCSDVGVCVFPSGTVPNWTWGSDETRIAAQFNCPSMEIHGTTISTNGSPSVPAPGEYRIEFTYDPNLEADNVKFEYFALNDSVAIGSQTLTEVLPSGSYRVGFASDNDTDDEGTNTPLNRTYISQLSIVVNDGDANFFDTLKNGYSGASNIVDLTVPVNILDTNGDNFITFTRTNTGTARIETPQDDLSLRSARDITLFAGSDGPGKVYIGWGDANYTPNATNEVATLGDIDESIANALGSATKTWTAPNDALYEIRQAHGGIQVTLDQPTSSGDVVSAVGNFINQTLILVSVPEILSGEFNNVYNGGQYFRRLTLDFNGYSRNFRISGSGPEQYQWYIECLDGPVTVYNSAGFYANLEYGGAPAVWWDADSLGFVSEGDMWKFRGAKIEYHAYSSDSGTMIGTIYIADDSGDNNVTHIETSSGGNDNGNVVLWKRYGNEGQLFAYRVDNEDDTVKIHWTAQVYYGTEYYD